MYSDCIDRRDAVEFQGGGVQTPIVELSEHSVKMVARNTSSLVPVRNVISCICAGENAIYVLPAMVHASDSWCEKACSKEIQAM